MVHDQPWKQALKAQLRRSRWRLARLLHAADALLLRYHYPQVTAWVQRRYPPGYVKECPPWGSRRNGRKIYSGSL